MLRIRSRLAALASLTLLAGLLTIAAPTASADQPWADAAAATIHPGVQTETEGAQCTANFVFTDGVDVFIGQAAHCSGTGAATDTDGCDAGSLGLGTLVDIDGADHPGVMTYNSWLAMQGPTGSPSRDACAYNDFALIKIDPRDHDKVNPSIPFWGGPVGLGDATAPFEEVYSYGNSSLRLGLSPLSPKTGLSLGSTAGGWTHPLYTVTPGIPGDSGSAFLDSEGNAIGVLSTLAIAPLAGSNNVTDLGSALAYANTVLEPDVTLVEGTEPFSPLL